MKSLIRRNIYLFLASMGGVIGQKKPLLTIFCYHSTCADDWYFSVDPTIFEQHIAALAASHQFISLEEVESFLQGKLNLNTPTAVITFDDGYKDLLSIFPITQKYNLKPTVFLLSNPEHANYAELETNRQFLSKNDIKKLMKFGWSFGSHTVTHANLSQLSKFQMEQEVKGSKDQLEKDFQTKVKWIAYPKGNYNTSVLRSVKKSGYTLGLSMDDGIIGRETNQFIIPRIGVNRSHSEKELLALNAPFNTFLRKFLKKSILNRL